MKQLFKKPSYYLISSAMDGNEKAIEKLLAFYDPYISKDATEKVFILRKVAQDKVYLYVLRYYILYAKTVFQWRHQSAVCVHFMMNTAMFISL